MIRAGAACLAVAALVASGVQIGCGGGGEPDGGPGSVAPASSLFYAESVLRPAGAEREALRASLSTLLGNDDPGAEIISRLNASLAEDGYSYEGDLAPWLGERGGLFLTTIFAADGEPSDGGFSAEGVEGAFVVESSNQGAARAFIGKVAADAEGAEEVAYEGSEYTLVEDGDAIAAVGDFVAFGSEEGVKAAIDTESGDSPIAEQATYTDALGDQIGSTATLYADVKAIVDEAEEAGELSAKDRARVADFLGGVTGEPLSASLEARAEGFGAEVAYGATDAPVLAAAEESALLRELPGDSWLALGFSELGDSVGSLIAAAEGLGVSEEEIDIAREQFRRDIELELEDFYEPFGDGAFFANGKGIFGTGAGLVVEADDPAAARRLVEGLGRAARRAGERPRPVSDRRSGARGFSLNIADAPATLNFIAAGKRVVVAYGDGATTAAVDPKEEGTLAESEEFLAAVEALGADYSVATYLDFAPLADLLGLAGVASPAIGAAAPYVESLDFLIAGSLADGERERLRAFLGISEPTPEPSV